MVDYFEAIKRPFQDIKKLIIGIVLSIIPIVNFVTLGYALKAGKAPTAKLPEWKDWGDLFVKGLAAIVISFIYMIPALLVFAFSVGMAITGELVTGNYEALLASIGGLGIGFILLLIGAYIIPAAQMTYVRRNKFGAAFELGKLSKQILTGKYLIAWLIAMVYAFVISAVIIGIFVFAGFYIPTISGAIARFIAMVTLFTIIGQVIK